jgi:coenzyme F420-0:L-glutamate ligase/coenzyme F420-1:gamma-L-glutamate ligase
MTSRVELVAIPGIPVIAPGDDLCAIISGALPANGLTPQHGDVFVVAQKIVSKAENRFVDLADLVPSPRAQELAQATGKDPRFLEAVLSESKRVVRWRHDLIIVEHRLGFVCANAGIDQSNVAAGGDERILLLPRDPDASAERLRGALVARHGVDVAVVINDSIGRAWRRGTIGTALGVAGLPALADLCGQPDLFGRALRTSTVGFADEIAAAASLLMGQGAEGTPVVLVRGLAWREAPNPAHTLIRPESEDLFR